MHHSVNAEIGTNNNLRNVIFLIKFQNYAFGDSFLI